MRFTTSGAAVGLLLASMVPAGAQMSSPPPPMMMSTFNWSGFYAGVNGGADISKFPGSINTGATPATAGVPGTPAPAPTSIPLKSGYNAAGTFGVQGGYNWQFYNNWLFGLEGDFKGDFNGQATNLTAPVNPAFNAIPFNSFAVRNRWDASVRGRLGYAWNNWLLYATGGIAFTDVQVTDNFQATVAGGLPFPGGQGSATKILSGPTVGGGVEYAWTNNVSLGGEYRYTDYGSTNFPLGNRSTFGGGTAAAPVFAFAPVNGNVGVRSHEVLLTINYHFNNPPPPPAPMLPPPPPPPVAAKVFIVFFDWDRDTITPEGQAIISQAADAYKAGAPVQIQVTGYTDRSGSPGYNQRLSERRANNVARALAALGVPREQMAVSGRGENDNRVPTAPGVREPQNRRVEIISP